MKLDYDVIVVGGGHAGVEAANISSKMKNKTALFTLNKNKIASTPCNPSMGGPAKGIVIKEVDSLGGLIGKVTDQSLLQIKMLNTSKGPGVRCLRAQIDKLEYSKNMLKQLSKNNNLQIIEKEVISLIVENNICVGIKTSNKSYLAKTVIITVGTFLDSKILIGDSSISEGPEKQKASVNLSNSLKQNGFDLFRLKTGTPPRIKKNTIDYSNMILQPGDEGNLSFSFKNENKNLFKNKKQEMCYLIHTKESTKKIIENNLTKSAMYSGNVKGVGPRYCPSIEDKIVRFSHKDKHQLFLEPESKKLDTIYLQGFSTSMPKPTQKKMIQSLPGFENSEILKYAYAIEYDAIDVRKELKISLESKRIKNLFFAGQINGTSGYEEAAGQGIIAGINASLKIKNKPPFILGRDKAYIGVMIDDLITKGTKEPYRLLTSRAEYRLLLRSDNADIRLMPFGINLGLFDQKEIDKFQKKMENIENLINLLKDSYVEPNKKNNDYLLKNSNEKIKKKITAYNLLKRPSIKIDLILDILKNKKLFSTTEKYFVETKIKYKGYIKKQISQASSYKKLEKILLPQRFDYSKIENLALEARQKLNQFKPLNLGQASRVSGINPSDINVLLIHIKKGDLKNEI